MGKRMLRSMTLATVWMALTHLVCIAQSTDNELAIYFNGELLEKPAKRIALGPYSYNKGIESMRSKGGFPLVIIDYELDADGRRTVYEIFFPATFELIFGSLEEAQNSKIFRATDVEGTRADVRGLEPGAAVSVYNSEGKLCLQTRAGNAGTVLNLESLPKGAYIVRSGQTAIKFLLR